MGLETKTDWLDVIYNLNVIMADEILRLNEFMCWEIRHTAGVAKLLSLVIFRLETENLWQVSYKSIKNKREL
jgi:predicted methyltransferase